MTEEETQEDPPRELLWHRIRREYSELVQRIDGRNGKRIAKLLRARCAAVFGVVVGISSIVGCIIGLVSCLAKDPSNFSHVRIASSPVNGENQEWAIPIAALDADYPVPVENAALCGNVQRNWLGIQGVPLERKVQLSMRNSAKEGPSLSLVDFRTTAQPATVRGEPQIRVVCTGSAQLPNTIYYARLDADVADSRARDVVLKRDTATQQEQKFLTVNLAPGETHETVFELFARNPARGSLEVTVLNGHEERVFEISDAEFDLPPLLFSGEMYLISTADGLRCERVDAGFIEQCTLEELRFEAATARR